MIADRPLDLVCLSYLADALVLRVTAYPPANHGAVVHEEISSIAADGPLTALTAASLGLRVGLIANQVGADPAGQRLTDWLTTAGIHHSIGHDPGSGTPRLTVITDDAGTRTWFAYLDAVYTQLHAAELGLLTQARLAYIDCYRVLTPAAARAVAATENTPLLLNLGGDPLDAATVTVRHTHGAGAAFSAGYAHALLTGASIGTALQAGCRAGTTHCAAAPLTSRPITSYP